MALDGLLSCRLSQLLPTFERIRIFSWALFPGTVNVCPL